jgi:CheY-like chemotaxis protein
VLEAAQACDVAIEQALRRLGGSLETYGRFLDRCIADIPKQVNALQEAIGSGDAKSAQRVAHTLKGVAATLGINTLASLSERVEILLAVESSSDLSQLAPVRQLMSYPLTGVVRLLRTLQAETTSPGLGGLRSLKGFTVLVVDDCDIQLDITSHLLRQLDAHVCAVGSGPEALAWLANPSHSCDAVLMDIQMPEMDGLEAIRRIRNAPSLRATPVIALSAGTDLEDRSLALEAGFNAFISKPVDRQEIIQVLDETLRLMANLPTVQGSNQLGAPLASTESGFHAVTCLDYRAALERLGGDEKLFLRTLKRMLEEFGDISLEAPPTGLDPSSAVSLAARMHKLKGTAGTVEAKDVFVGAGLLEKLLRSGHGISDQAALVECWHRVADSLSTLRLSTQSLVEAATSPPCAVGAVLPLSTERLEEFCELLRDQDLNALTFFDEYSASFVDRLGPDAARNLSEMLESLDFVSALEVLAQKKDL